MTAISHHKVVASLPDTLEPGSIYYVRTGSGFDIYTTNDKGIIDSYRLNADRKIENHTESGGAAHDLASSESAGFMSPEQVLALNSQVQYFNADGAIPRGQIKAFFGVAVTGATGEFSINWEAADFASAPLHVSAVAQSPAATKAWATVSGESITTTGCTGAAISGLDMQMTLGKAKPTTKPASGVRVTVLAWGL